MRASGISWGRKSFNQNAWDLGCVQVWIESPPSPWTATMSIVDAVRELFGGYTMDSAIASRCAMSECVEVAMVLKSGQED